VVNIFEETLLSQMFKIYSDICKKLWRAGIQFIGFDLIFEELQSMA